MSTKQRIPTTYTIWKRVGLNWLPTRTYLSKEQALGLAKDWATDGEMYRVTSAEGKEIKRFGRMKRYPIPEPSAN